MAAFSISGSRSPVTGAQVGEALKAKWTDIKPDGEILFMSKKGRKLHPDVVTALASLKQDGKYIFSLRGGAPIR